MPMLTVQQGGPDIDDGAYEVTLLKIDGPITITPKNGVNAGKDIDIYEWFWQIDGVLDPNGYPVELKESSSTAFSPRSKMYAWVSALAGGKPPAVGANVDTDTLIGRRAIATINRPPEGGWPRITVLSPIPAARLAQGIAAATGAPTRGTPPARTAAPLNLAPTPTEPPAQDDLPF